MTKPRLYILFVTSIFVFTLTEFFVTGTIGVFGPFPFANGVLIAILALWWLRLDAEDGHPSGYILKVFTVVFVPLPLMYHLFRTRGFKKGIVAIVAMIGLLVLFSLSGRAGEYVVQILRS